MRFALSSANAWRDVDIDFNHIEFYSAIVDYFELTPGPVTLARVDDLLAWWNRLVSIIFDCYNQLSLSVLPGKFLAVHRD